MESTVQSPASTSLPTPAASAFVAPTPKRELWPSLGLGQHLGAVVLLGAIVLFAFVNTLQNTGFALDNKFIILEDPRLRDWKRENLKLIFTQDYWFPKAVSGLYRPLTTLSYWANYTLFGNADKAAGYHWVNFFLHWMNAVLAYFVVLVLMEKFWPSFFTAAIFAVHPIVTESVTNIVGRADLFAMAAVLGGLLAYAKSTVTRGWRRPLWLLLLTVLTTLGGFCKESAVVVLGVLFLYDLTFRFYRRHQNWFVSLGQNIWEFVAKGYVAVLPPLFAMFYVRSQVFGRLRPPELPFVDNPLIDADFWTARLTAIKVIGKYFGLLLWPKTLSCDYSYNQVPIVSWQFRTWEDWQALVALAAILGLIGVAIRNFRRNKALFFFILFFFGTLLPASNLIPNPTFGQSLWDKTAWCIGSIMAERFLYIPSLGFAGCLVIVVYALSRLAGGKLHVSGWGQGFWIQVMAPAILGLIVVACGVRTFFRNFDWDNDIALWTKALEAAPNSFKSHKSLAFALYEKDPEGRNIDRIIEEGEKAAAITDRAPIVFLHNGAYYRIKGDLTAQRAVDGSLLVTPDAREWYAKSVKALQKAVSLDRAFNEDNRQKEIKRGRAPDTIADIGNHHIYWNLGISLMRLGQIDEALQAYLYMRHLAPGNADAYLSIASVHLAKSQFDEAAVALLQALLLDNKRQEALHLLINIYGQIDKEGCALSATLSHPQTRLNADCTIVRQHICNAYYGLVQVFLAAKQPAVARQIRDSGLKDYGCNPAPFHELLPEVTS